VYCTTHFVNRSDCDYRQRFFNRCTGEQLTSAVIPRVLYNSLCPAVADCCCLSAHILTTFLVSGANQFSFVDLFSVLLSLCSVYVYVHVQWTELLVSSVWRGRVCIVHYHTVSYRVSHELCGLVAGRRCQGLVVSCVMVVRSYEERS